MLDVGRVKRWEMPLAGWASDVGVRVGGVISCCLGVVQGCDRVCGRRM